MYALSIDSSRFEHVTRAVQLAEGPRGDPNGLVLEGTARLAIESPVFSVAGNEVSAIACAYACAYHGPVADYEWDPAKAAANRAKHGVDFSDAVGVLEDDRAITIEDTSTNEERFKTLGSDFLGQILVVVYTYRDNRIRLISARKATARQRDTYDRKRR